MKLSEYRFFILSDLYRVSGNVSYSTLLKYVLAGESYKYCFWMRTCNFARTVPLLRYTLYPVAKYMHHRLSYKYGISIPIATDIGSGFYIGHFGGIVVNGKSVIGRNCNISQGVTLGQANRGKNKGFPVIGDNVYLGPGAKIVGAVRIGNNVAVGANCVVTCDVPDNAVVVGIPGKVISSGGAEHYVELTDYEDKIS